MRRILAFLGGILTGGAVGTAATLLLTPVSGDSLRTRLNTRWQAALQAGQDAALNKRAALEAKLVEMTAPHSADSPLLTSGETEDPA